MRLSASATSLMQQAISSSTRGAYVTAVRNYQGWCQREGVAAELLNATSASVVNWLAHLHDARVNSSTISAYKSGLKTLWCEAVTARDGRAPDTPDWDSATTARILKGIKHAAAAGEAEARQESAATPLLPQMFEEIWRTRGATTPQESMMYAAAACALWGGMRAGEVLGERMGVNADVKCTRANGATATSARDTEHIGYAIRKSKTDQTMQGAEAHIAGATPVEAWWNWWNARPQHERGGRAPLFQLGDQALKLSALNAFIQRRLHAEGYTDAVIMGRSYRRGAATAEAAAGASAEAIKRAGRWKLEAYKHYVDPAVANRQAAIARGRRDASERE